MSEVTSGIEGQLYDIDATLGGIVGSLERICEAIERMSHERNEEEEIALQLFIHNPETEAVSAFRQAEAFTNEMWRLRAQRLKKTDAQPTI